MRKVAVVCIGLALLAGCKGRASAPPTDAPSASVDVAPPRSSGPGAADGSAPFVVRDVPDGGVFLGRTIASPMSHRGAAWLDRAGRDDVQKPTRVLEVIGVRAGQTVADFGAGTGYFTIPLARAVGPTGKVYAVDIQPEMLAILGERVAAQKLVNVVPVRAEPTAPSLPKGAVDLVLFVDVYHELERPDLTMTQLRDALAPSGRVVWVEYRAEDPKVAIKPDHKTTLAQLRREATALGWVVERVDESLPEQRIVILAPAR